MKTNIIFKILFLLELIYFSDVKVLPNWLQIKSNATFIVSDTNYNTPIIQPINVGGWEDGLFITRNGKNLYSTYMSVDIFSWAGDIAPCLNYVPYFRPPLLNIDTVTVTNPFAFQNHIYSDIIRASRADTSLPINLWSSTLIATIIFDRILVNGIIYN